MLQVTLVLIIAFIAYFFLPIGEVAMEYSENLGFKRIYLENLALPSLKFLEIIQARKTRIVIRVILLHDLIVIII
jgi:hypothetical protein